MKYVFAGDRDISVSVLQFLMDKGYPPSGLMVVESEKASHAKELVALSGLPPEMVLHGKDFSSVHGIKLLKELEIDYIFGIHFPYIISNNILAIPHIGFLNLHPALLPFNKGWHTPSWAILDSTPYGATLHYMSEKLDEGDIIHQKQCEITPADTADSLYKRVKTLELEVFKEAFPDLLTLKPKSFKQEGKGTLHQKKLLKTIQKLDLNEMVKTADLINKLRAMTTNQIEEAAYFIEDGKKYFVQVQIIKEKH